MRDRFLGAMLELNSFFIYLFFIFLRSESEVRIHFFNFFNFFFSWVGMLL